MDGSTSTRTCILSLARSAGRVKTREQLLLAAAERDFEVFDRSIDVHVSSLRKKWATIPGILDISRLFDPSATA